MSRSRTTTRRPRLATVAFVVLGLLLGLLGPLVASSRASATVCEAPWGSLPKTSSSHTTKPLTGVRTGQQLCYDRLVLDIGRSGTGAVGYDVRYVSVVGAEGSGAPLPVRGDADIKVTVNAPAYNVSTGAPTYTPSNPNELSNVSGYRTFRQLRWAGSFEGQSTIALGVRARLPMRVFVLSDTDGSRRLVVDVAHLWY
ncbi:hypothetical protein PZ938_15195 [Luteipulveratus sp. YIM 133132]|uniref:AMIN-like domain-containing protein n=1 Tax=Luteipulveratus flavus TaxID=3031728 RepID=A0ABT6C779_9MICO|nr:MULTISPECIES: hypothetical protein [unclassified Luteipulveratus]MDE9366960.1 hypothetical protein [Luteipulveratus sp. YIM 133132]MDF8264798.1 hypothetical protein [Luteipulveratus sp. YIM 133296]